ncbi:unnamed protein product, partial [Pelagomonas calceolata]
MTRLCRIALLLSAAAASTPPRLNLRRGTDAEGRRTATVSLRDVEVFEASEDEARYEGEGPATTLSVRASNDSSVTGVFEEHSEKGLTDSLERVNDALDDLELIIPTTDGEGYTNVTFSTRDRDGREASQTLGLGVQIEDVVVLESITPSSSPLAGGVRVRLDAPGLVESVRGDVEVFGTSAWACVFGDVSTSISEDGSCVAPPSNTSVALALRSPSGQHTNEVPFSYRDLPDVDALAPDHGAPGLLITLTVHSVADASDNWRCRFGATEVRGTAVIGNGLVESIRCTTPSLKGLVDVSASFDGVSFGAGQLFTYQTPPQVAEAVLEEDQLLVRGSGFVNTSTLTCRVDGIDQRATYVSEKEVVCASRVAGDLTVTTDGRAFSSPWKVAGRASITIEDVSIRRASSEGGEVMRVTGRGFSNGVECAFGSNRVKARIINEKELTCIVPSVTMEGALRPAPLTVRNGDIVSSSVAFYYYASVERKGRLPIDTFPLGEPASVRIELESPLGALCAGSYCAADGIKTPLRCDDAHGHVITCKIAPPPTPSVMNLGLVHASDQTSEKMWSLRWYSPPEVQVEPATGPARGGSRLNLPPTVTHCRIGTTVVKAPCATPAAALAGVIGGDAAVDVEVSVDNGKRYYGAGSFRYESSEIYIREVKPSSVSTRGGRTLSVRGAFPASDSIACLFDDVAVPAQQSPEELKCTSPLLADVKTVCLRIAVNGRDADTSCSSLIVRPPAQILSIKPSTIVSEASTTVELSIGKTPRSSIVECRVGALTVAASYINDESVTCRLPSLTEGSYDVSLSVDGETSQPSELVVFDLESIKVIPGRGPIIGGSQLQIETNLTDVLCVFADVGSSNAITTEKGLQCPTPRSDKPQTTELTLVDQKDGSQRSLPLSFEFYASPVVGGVAPAVVGDDDTVTISGNNFPRGRARCRFGSQVIVVSEAVWRDGLRCRVPPRHKDEDNKASRAVEVAFEGSDFLKTRTSIAHVLRPPSSNEVTQLVQGAIKDLKTIHPSSGSLFGGTPVDVKGQPGFMANVSGGYCVFDDDVGTFQVIDNTTVRCRAPSGRQPGSVQVMVRAGLELHGGVTYEYRAP